MAKEKNAGSYARGAVPRRSADHKADRALRPFFERKATMEAIVYTAKGGSTMDAIIYTTNTGSTGQYAKLLAQETGLPAYSLAEAKKRVFAGAEVVYLGWIMAGSVKGCAGAAKRYQVCAVCGVGMGQTGTQTDSVRKKSEIPANIPLFTLQGNFNVKKLHGIYRFMMEIMVKTVGKGLAAKKDRTPEEDDMLDMMLHGGERVKAENLSAILDWYRAQQ